MDYKDKWINLPIVYNENEQFIHPEDMDKYLSSSTSIFKCTKIVENYIFLKHGDLTIRVRYDDPSLLIVNKPVAMIGDSVRLTKMHDKIGSVVALGWHFKRKKIIYTLCLNEKISDKWYWSEDFEVIG